jgi:hypothetical protein
MPACNFGSSEYITLGLLIGYHDLSNDSSYMEEVKERAMEVWEFDHYDEELSEEEPDLTDIMDNIIYKDIEIMYEDDFEESEYLINECNFNYIHINIEPGYYEGAWLQISLDYNLEDEEDREILYAEIGKFGELLLELADIGWRTCSSHCYAGTSRATFEQTCADIADALQEMMQEVQETEIYDYNDPANDWEE